MFKDAWSMRLAEVAPAKRSQIAAQLREHRTSRSKRFWSALSNLTILSIVIKAYEAKIGKLERKKLLLAEKAAQIVSPGKGRLEEFIEPALNFLGKPLESLRKW
jgi:hypothetical protein